MKNNNKTGDIMKTETKTTNNLDGSVTTTTTKDSNSYTGMGAGEFVFWFFAWVIVAPIAALIVAILRLFGVSKPGFWNTLVSIIVWILALPLMLVLWLVRVATKEKG